MIKEFEGKNEREAIEKAAEELGLATDEFEVEIIDSEVKRGLFFKKGSVKIRVHYTEKKAEQRPVATEKRTRTNLEPSDELERSAIDFLEKTIDLMGFPGKIDVTERENGKFTLNIVSEHASILIGKKGKNLDALQLLVNVYLSSLINEEDSLRVVVDAEDYRNRREESIVRSAIKNADIVAKTKSSRLLEPMNPFERRLVHTALNERHDVITQSEGDGLYKQVRILYKGSR